MKELFIERVERIFEEDEIKKIKENELYFKCYLLGIIDKEKVG